ncbi:cytochrome P450 [Rhodotorula toruloides]|uniref:Cytochrome P450 n=1 Tax=Rhodotorula toruloides TaxID=5286 RepID=A0A511K7I5_RHOTO|nr:cytochrome P450 [Rhodotorula toruloides]
MPLTQAVNLASEHLPLTVVLTILASLASWAIYNAFFSPLADVPGPLSARFGLGSWMSSRALKYDMGWALAELHKQHGTAVRVSRNMVSLVDPSVITEIYRYGGSYEKTSFYTYFRADKPSLMSTLGNHDHALMRRAESPAYTMTLLVDLEDHVDSCLEDLVSYLDKAIVAGKGKGTVDMGMMMQLLAMDVIGELAFGGTFGLCKAGKDTQGFLPMLEAFVDVCCLCGTQPWAGLPLIAFCNWKVGAQGPQALAAKSSKAVKDRLAQIKKAYETGDEPRRDMLSKLVMAKNADGSPYSVRQIEVAASSILGAGSDTTAITMRALLYFIVRDPAVYAKVMRELEDAFESGLLSLPVKYSGGTKLSYFQSCLKETLRLHPAVPWTLPRVVPKDGAVLAGRYFAPGTQVAMSPFVFHRRTEAFGPDAAVFRPERWLEATEEEKKVMERNLITFGSGSRVCIGKNISLMEITKVLPTLFWKYRFSFTPRNLPNSPHRLPGRTVDGTLDDKEPWHVKSQWFAVQHDFWVDVEEREEA